MWKLGIFHLSFSFRGKGFVRINVIWKYVRIFIFNVYSSCAISNTRRLWRQLCDFKIKFPRGEWCVVRDFNAIK